jgi:hypothetical protein
MGVSLGWNALCGGLLIVMKPTLCRLGVQQGSPGHAFQGDQIRRVKWYVEGCRVKRGYGHDDDVLFSGYAAPCPAYPPGIEASKSSR